MGLRPSSDTKVSGTMSAWASSRPPDTDREKAACCGARDTHWIRNLSEELLELQQHSRLRAAVVRRRPSSTLRRWPFCPCRQLSSVGVVGSTVCPTHRSQRGLDLSHVQGTCKQQAPATAYAQN